MFVAQNVAAAPRLSEPLIQTLLAVMLLRLVHPVTEKSPLTIPSKSAGAVKPVGTPPGPTGGFRLAAPSMMNLLPFEAGSVPKFDVPLKRFELPEAPYVFVVEAVPNVRL